MTEKFIACKVTRKQWEAYLVVQRGGLTNMLHMTKVCDIADDIYEERVLNTNAVAYIIDNYSELAKHFTQGDF